MKKRLSTKNALFITCIALIAIVSLVTVVFFLSKDKNDRSDDEILLLTTPTPTVKVNIPRITDDIDKKTTVPTEEPIVSTPTKTDTTNEDDGADVDDNNDKIPTEAIVEESKVVEEVKEKIPVEKPKEDAIVEKNKDVPKEDKEHESEIDRPVIDKGETTNTIPEPKEEDKPVYGQDDNTDPGENPFGKGGTIIDESPAEDYVDPVEGGLGEGVSF